MLLSNHDILKLGGNLTEGTLQYQAHLEWNQQPTYKVVPHQYQITLYRDVVWSQKQSDLTQKYL